MKCNQSRPGFELVLPCPFPTTITITPQALPINFYSAYTTSLKTVYIHYGRKLGHLLASLIYFASLNTCSILAKTSFFHFLIKRKFGCVLTSDKYIFNFSSYVLSDCESLILSRGLNFCVLPSHNI